MMKIFRIKTRSITNLLSPDNFYAYGAWMTGASRVLEESSIKTAKRVLGTQDFCWVGAWGIRNWIWERKYSENLHWRLYASTRGFSLEVETSSQDCSEADYSEANQALAHFIKSWKENDNQFNYEAENRYLSLFQNR